jgi:hypothetical protein
MIAIKPPLLVPPIKSKYSHGLTSAAPSCCSMSFIISRNMKSEDNPLTPPPSSERILGMCADNTWTRAVGQFALTCGNQAFSNGAVFPRMPIIYVCAGICTGFGHGIVFPRVLKPRSYGGSPLQRGGVSKWYYRPPRKFRPAGKLNFHFRHGVPTEIRSN